MRTHAKQYFCIYVCKPDANNQTQQKKNRTTNFMNERKMC